MKYWTEFEKIKYKSKVLNNVTSKEINKNIFTFDIETTTIVKINGTWMSLEWIKKASYQPIDISDYEHTSYMYIWQFSINDDVFFGRTWKEFYNFFLQVRDRFVGELQIFVHNLSYEFSYIQNIGLFYFNKVFARKAHKPIYASDSDLKVKFRCTYIMTNKSLETLAKEYNLPVKKKVGDLDYDKIRTSSTILTPKELEYAEYDCLVLYYYILYLTKSRRQSVDKLPNTSTGFVRRELRNRIYFDSCYKKTVINASNTEIHIRNLLTQAFAGGYTHANILYVGEIIKKLTGSADFTSSYPYGMATSNCFPMSKFVKIDMKSVDEIKKGYAYILKLKLNKVQSIKWATILSSSKINTTKMNGRAYTFNDNGRVEFCEECEYVCTNLDIEFLTEFYKIDEIEVLEAYRAYADYLPIKIVEYILELFKNKTDLKGVDDTLYAISKTYINALYGMTVTNNITDEIQFNAETLEWSVKECSRDELISKLDKEVSQGFLVFAWGVFVTSEARNRLLKLFLYNEKDENGEIHFADEYIMYSDTDSIKYIKNSLMDRMIKKYNQDNIKLINKVCADRGFKPSDFMPTDKKGNPQILGSLTLEDDMIEFKTLGAKKYCYRTLKDNNLHLTLSGVPKAGVNALENNIENFKKGFVFSYKNTKKNTVEYIKKATSGTVVDCFGQAGYFHSIGGACIYPTTYKLTEFKDTYLNDLLKFDDYISENGSDLPRKIIPEK